MAFSSEVGKFIDGNNTRFVAVSRPCYGVQLLASCHLLFDMPLYLPGQSGTIPVSVVTSLIERRFVVRMLGEGRSCLLLFDMPLYLPGQSGTIPVSVVTSLIERRFVVRMLGEGRSCLLLFDMPLNLPGQSGTIPVSVVTSLIERRFVVRMLGEGRSCLLLHKSNREKSNFEIGLWCGCWEKEGAVSCCLTCRYICPVSRVRYPSLLSQFVVRMLGEGRSCLLLFDMPLYLPGQSGTIPVSVVTSLIERRFVVRMLGEGRSCLCCHKSNREKKGRSCLLLFDMPLNLPGQSGTIPVSVVTSLIERRFVVRMLGEGRSCLLLHKSNREKSNFEIGLWCGCWEKEGAVSCCLTCRYVCPVSREDTRNCQLSHPQWDPSSGGERERYHSISSTYCLHPTHLGSRSKSSQNVPQEDDLMIKINMIPSCRARIGDADDAVTAIETLETRSSVKRQGRMDDWTLWL
ncbi:hypothetical protein J6590_018143 [Homalodisca vitripennis]|nr:hypothetical protein J6590_018143 [Homalodisca vitripennis]